MAGPKPLSHTRSRDITYRIFIWYSNILGSPLELAAALLLIEQSPSTADVKREGAQICREQRARRKVGMGPKVR
jgi:hypothetical protein